MPTSLEELESAALQLEPLARAELVRRLVRTLDPEAFPVTDDEWLESWVNEALRRNQEIDSGQVIPLDGPETLKRWQERYR